MDRVRRDGGHGGCSNQHKPWADIRDTDHALPDRNNAIAASYTPPLPPQQWLAMPMALMAAAAAAAAEGDVQRHGTNIRRTCDNVRRRVSQPCGHAHASCTSP